MGLLDQQLLLRWSQGQLKTLTEQERGKHRRHKMLQREEKQKKKENNFRLIRFRLDVLAPSQYMSFGFDTHAKFNILKKTKDL